LTKTGLALHNYILFNCNRFVTIRFMALHYYNTLLQYVIYYNISTCNITILILLHNNIIITTNVTGHHRGPKQKLRTGYRTWSLKRTSYVSSWSVTDVILFIVESVLCVYSKFRHHPHP